MLGFIRKHSSSIWVKVGLCVVASTFLFFFGMSDVINKITGNDYIVKVGDVKIGPNLFKFEVQKRAERLKEWGITDENQVTNIVISQIVNEELIKQMAEHFGLLVNDDTVKLYMYGIPMFRTKEGLFNKAAVRSLMMNMRLRESDFIAYMKREVQSVLLMFPLSMCKSRLLATNYVAANLENRDIKYVNISYHDFPAKNNYTDDDLEECYKNHSSEFMLPETRDFTVLVINESDLLRDIAISDDDVMSEYKARSETAEFDTVRDEIHASLVNSELEDKLNKLIRLIEDDFTSGLSCAEIAEKYKLTKSEFKKIPANYHSPANSTTALPFMEDVMKAAFALELNQESSFVEGLDKNNKKVHWLVHNDNIAPAHPEAFAEVKNAVIKIWQSEKQKEAAKAIAQECVDLINTGVAIDYVVEKYGYRVMEIKNISRFDDASDAKFKKHKLITNTLIHSAFGVSNLHANLVDNQDGYTVFEVISAYTPKDIDEQKTIKLNRQFVASYTQELLTQMKQYYAKKVQVKVNKKLLKGSDNNYMPDVDF